VKKLVSVLTVSVLGLGLATGAWAQARPSTDPGATGAKKTDDAQRQAWSPDANAIETSKLVGTQVKTVDGKSIGAIDQLIVNHADGKITHAIIGKGGVLGMGETKLVLAWSDVKLQRDPDRTDRWVAVVDQAKLDAAPRYEARRDRDTPPAASPGSTPPAGRTNTNAPAKKY
jgi:sporulation protein YlmC with PRC-barrel domain